MKPKTRQIAIRLPTRDLNRVVKLANARRSTVAQVVREAIVRFLEEVSAPDDHS